MRYHCLVSGCCGEGGGEAKEAKDCLPILPQGPPRENGKWCKGRPIKSRYEAKINSTLNKRFLSEHLIVSTMQIEILKGNAHGALEH